MTTKQSDAMKLILDGAVGDELEKIVQILERLFEDEKLNPALLPKSPDEIRQAMELSIPEEGKAPQELYALIEAAVMGY